MKLDEAKAGRDHIVSDPIHYDMFVVATMVLLKDLEERMRLLEQDYEMRHPIQETSEWH